jgi:uncharacterized protein YgbK (DUF1537 family)
LAAAGPLDAIGIAGASRTLSPAEMDQQLPRAFQTLSAAGARIIHYKTCSTFDSSPSVGSIGHAIQIGRRIIPGRFIPIVVGQPNLGRYCVFGTLFAAGPDGVVDRLDRHPVMRCHPSTPMDEADLRRHLARQGIEKIARFDWLAYQSGAAAAAERLDRELERQPDAILFDVLNEDHLRLIGRLVWSIAQRDGPIFAVGSTGLEQALLAGWRMDQPISGERVPLTAPKPVVPKPVAPKPVDRTFIISGSCSQVTAAQIDAASNAGFSLLEIDPARLVDAQNRGQYLDTLTDLCVARLDAGMSVLVHSSRGLEDPRNMALDRYVTCVMMDRRDALRQLAVGCGNLLARVLERVSLKRIGIAGGDTSSIAIQKLAINALSFSYSLSPGVAVCRAHAPGYRLDGLEIMLKGGQMGGSDIFAALKDGRSV